MSEATLGATRMNNLAMLRTRADSRRDLAETEARRGAAQGQLADLRRQYSDVRAEAERITDRLPQIRRLPKLGLLGTY